MSRFNDLHCALDFLQRPELKTIARNLSDFIQGLVGPYLEKEGYPKAIASLMNLRLCHVILKNRSWCHSKQFQSLIVSDFQNYFGVNKDFCEKLVSLVASELEELLETSYSYGDDRYLEFLFLKIATSANIANVSEELGIDAQIIKRIKKSAQMVFSRQGVKCSDEIQLAVKSVVMKYAKKMKKIPWALDIARLEFALPDFAFEWELFRREEGRHMLFNILMYLGERQCVKGSDLSQVFFEQVQQYTAEEGCSRELDADDLLKLMLAANLIYTETARKTLRSSSFCLAELGFEVTANAYAYENKMDIERKPSGLVMIQEPYQIHLLRLMSKDGLLNLAKVLDRDHALSKGAIRVFSERMVYINESEQLAKILTVWMSEHPSYWIRESAVAATAHLRSSDKIRLCLQGVAKSDSSCAVQSKAIEMLMLD